MTESPGLDFVPGLEQFIQQSVLEAGSNRPVPPAHRQTFHWPPHSVAAQFHVGSDQWTEKAEVEIDGDSFVISVARTPFGVFGRCEELWHDARGDTYEEMTASLADIARPKLERQRLIAKMLGVPGRHTRTLKDATPDQLLRVLYCPNRDIAAVAQQCIETHRNPRQFFPALVRILRDDQHPHRRSAQWCVLDMFEDLPAFAKTESQISEAIDALKELILNAEDDYARTIYKAGVVLGGHISSNPAADALIACLTGPHRVGRRSSMHAVFHLCEWLPERREEVLAVLDQAADSDSEPRLRDFARGMARDIRAGGTDHLDEPIFTGEVTSC